MHFYNSDYERMTETEILTFPHCVALANELSDVNDILAEIKRRANGGTNSLQDYTYENKELFLWLDANGISEDSFLWNKNKAFLFRDEIDAMAFKLKWE